MNRFALIVTLVVLTAGITATSGSTASFDDTNPCPADGALLVCPAAQVGQPFSLQLRALAGCDLYRWEITNGGLPPGLTISSSGLVSGTPTASGDTEPWITVHDLLPAEGGNSWCGGDNHSERQFVFSAAPGLSIQNQSVPGGTIGQAYSVTFTALSVTNTNPVQGTPASATWSVQSGSLPEGVSLSSSGVLSGTPTTEGSYTFVVKAAGGGNATDTETETLVVRQPLVASSPLSRRATASRAEVGVAFEAALTASGGGGTFTWTVAPGSSLPAGLTLASDGQITGTPTTAGSYTFVATVTDQEQRTARVTSTITVAAKLTIAPLRLKSATVGRAYRARILTIGGVAPKTWSIRGKLPQGVTLKKLGMLLGVPRKAGTYRFTVTALDALGVSSSKKLTLVVR